MQNHDVRGIRPRVAAVLGGLLLLASCGSTSRTVVISVNPPEASVYINGEAAGKGNARPHQLSFAQSTRVYVQATAPGFEPRIDWFTLEDVDRMLDHGLDLNMTLRQR